MRPDRNVHRTGHNRLPRRGTDRVEDAAAWLLASLALLGLLVAVLNGFDTYVRGVARARDEAADRTPVRVVLLEPAPGGPAFGRSSPRWIAVRWTGPDGLEHRGSLIPTSPATVGTELNSWVDGAGRLTGPPATVAGAAWAGVLITLGVASTSWIAVAALWESLRELTMARNIEGWAREWAKVAPRWSHPTL